MLKLAAALALCATSAAAEGWQVMYLAGSGGSRPMQVGPNEGGIPFAYVDNAKGERLFLECHETGSTTRDYTWTIRIYPGTEPNFLPKDSQGNQFTFTFDGTNANYGIGNFTFVQDAFWADINEYLAADIRTHSMIRLEMPGQFVEGGKTYRTEFTLAGSTAALNTACPPL